MRSFKTLVALRKTPAFGLFQRRNFLNAAFKNLSLKSHQNASFGIISAEPLPRENKTSFKERMQKEVASLFSNYGNQLLVMSYPTRIAYPEETLRNAAKWMDNEEIDRLNLPLTDQSILAGHCLATFVDHSGKTSIDYTFSLRPNMQKKPLYQTKMALDTRLPAQVLHQKVPVRPSMHTTLQHEIGVWAETAFYTYYVHRSRPAYPLTYLFKPMDSKEINCYAKTIKELKSICDRYSLLDHLHPYTGDTHGQIVPAQNCTSVFRLFEKLMSVNLEKMLGDNPTPQLVKKVVMNLYFKTEENNTPEASDMFMQPYCRP